MAPPETGRIGAFDAAGPEDAPAVVLVHGSVVTRKMWLPQLRGLSDAFRVVAPDLPGHGSLAHLRWSVDASLDVLAETIESEAGGRAVVAGISLGGYLAIELAHRRPRQIAALVLAGCSRDPSGIVGLYLRAVSGLLRRGWLRQGREQAERKTMKLFPPELRDDAEEQRRAGVYPDPLGDQLAAIAGRKWSALLAEYPGPTLLLNGERDSMARAGERRFLAAARRARIEIVEGAGHACSLERPVAFERAVREFLSSAVGPPWSTARPTSRSS